MIRVPRARTPGAKNQSLCLLSRSKGTVELFYMKDCQQMMLPTRKSSCALVNKVGAWLLKIEGCKAVSNMDKHR
eukprot:4163265-Amphidinium_carterae.1